MPDHLKEYHESGWTVFDHDPQIEAWVQGCAPIARDMLNDPALSHWYRCDGTWFAGVNVLSNDREGALPGHISPLSGMAVDFVQNTLGMNDFNWDQGQISAVFPGYPRHGVEDTEASFRYRLNRFAAHVDGLERTMPDRRRKLSETHSFLLGLPLVNTGPDEAPFVVWQGSHEIMRTAFKSVLDGIDPAHWFAVDVTQAYVEARRACFDTCEPVAIAPGVGSAYVMHPLTLHGVAPWKSTQTAPRMIAYFRPDAFGGDPVRWLEA